MSSFFERAYQEHRRQATLRRTFAKQTEKIGSLTAVVRPHTLSRQSILLVFPLIEVAWADGRVSRREMEAIMHAAEAYRLVDDLHGYRTTVEWLLSRQPRSRAEGLWGELRLFLGNLDVQKRSIVISSMLSQARFVAEQSSESLIPFLRGEAIGSDEREAIRMMVEHLEKTNQEPEVTNVMKVKDLTDRERLTDISPKAADGLNERRDSLEENQHAPATDLEKLTPLVPLVHVAWAEGRVTKRERELIFAAAKRRGIGEDSKAYGRLNDWVDFHPTEEFYMSSLMRLSKEMGDLPAEERALLRLDLLSDCVNIAEASGGTSRYPAGGVRVCKEEFEAVKRVATMLAPSNGLAMAA